MILQRSGKPLMGSCLCVAENIFLISGAGISDIVCSHFGQAMNTLNG